MLNVTQISIGRFHHFHLARQLERRNLLDAIYTGYPRFKLKDEQGIPRAKLKSFPYLQGPYMAREKLGLHRWSWLNREWAWHAHETLDRYVSKHLTTRTILLALSGCGLKAGRRAQILGGKHVCDRGSTHIRQQDQLLREEYKRYGCTWQGVDPRTIAKEEAEYDQADLISVPSTFCYDSFVEQGIPRTKLVKIPYGANLSRFSPSKLHGLNFDVFRVLFVGQASPRKGFIDLLNAFGRFKHPRKRLVLIGTQSKEAMEVLSKADQSSIEILGRVPNEELRHHYSSASVFVLPSIEEGLAMVIGEAMACGCPVIATMNTGVSELITDGVEGFIVPIHSPKLIDERLQQLSDQPDLREQMSHAALSKVRNLGGWDLYGDAWAGVLHSLAS